MDKGIIIHLDDRQARLDEGANYFEQIGLQSEFDLIMVQKREDFEKQLEDNYANLKCLIFDLWGDINPESSGEGDAKFLDNIKHIQYIVNKIKKNYTESYKTINWII